MSRYATILMIVLGLATILVNVAVAAVLIALGLAMYLFERRLQGRVERSLGSSE